MDIDGKGGVFTETLTTGGPVYQGPGFLIVWSRNNPAILLRAVLAGLERMPGPIDREALSAAISNAIDKA